LDKRKILGIGTYVTATIAAGEKNIPVFIVAIILSILVTFGWLDD